MIRTPTLRAPSWKPGFLLALSVLLAAPANAELHEYKVALCQSCHGADGMPSDPNIPILAGQEFYYLYVQLRDYKAGRRQNAIMSGMVADMDKDTMQALAMYFSEQEWPATGFSASDAAVKQARKATAAGQCVQCHLGGYEGNSRVPRVAGQQVGYLEQTLLDFKYRRRQNSPAKNSLLKDYSDEDIGAMARFLGGL